MAGAIVTPINFTYPDEEIAALLARSGATIAVVLSSLYPVIPVLLGLTVLRERLGLGQALGLVGAGVAVVLLSVG
jgi:drug/metabolite transporter (DMT)-like permease